MFLIVWFRCLHTLPWHRMMGTLWQRSRDVLVFWHWGTAPGACEEVPPMRISVLPCESPSGVCRRRSNHRYSRCLWNGRCALGSALPLVRAVCHDAQSRRGRLRSDIRLRQSLAAGASGRYLPLRSPCLQAWQSNGR